MKLDSVNNLLIQWSKNRPAMDVSSLGLAVRVDRLAAELSREANCALAPHGLALWEYDVLSTLRRQLRPHELPATRIAAETRMSSGAITHRVTRLVERGWVRRKRDPGDRRTVLVRLTEDGKDQVDSALGARIAAVADSLTVLSKAEQRTLDRLLGKWLAGSEESGQ